MLYYVFVSTATISILQLICFRQRIERNYLVHRRRAACLAWPEISWIYAKYIRIVKDTENHNYFFTKAFGFLFAAAASYAVFQFVVIFFHGYNEFIVGMTLNTSATLFMVRYTFTLVECSLILLSCPVVHFVSQHVRPISASLGKNFKDGIIFDDSESNWNHHAKMDHKKHSQCWPIY